MSEKLKISHAKANEYRDLCKNAGDILKEKEVNQNPNVIYEIIKKEYNHKNNFKAIAYKKDNEIVICFLGTDKLNYKDHATNLKMAVSSEPTSQMINANDFYKSIKEIYPKKNITLIGHSEGGSEALFVGFKNKVPTVTFNSYGLHKNLEKAIDAEKQAHLITNYRDPQDPVSKLRPLVGTTYVVENPKEYGKVVTPLGSIKSHKISNFGDCENAVPLEEYKEKNKNFVDQFAKFELTRNTIGNMSNDLFTVYEDSIMERVSQGRVFNDAHAYELSMKGDLVKVQSYHRQDGTFVEGYYRSKPEVA